jgi:hypothetical protein
MTGNVISICENGATSGAGVLAAYAYGSLGHCAGAKRCNNATDIYDQV